MPSVKSGAKVTIDRAKNLPWAALLQVGIVLRRRWMRLSDKDRGRLLRLMRDSRGRVSNLSARDRNELRRLVVKADLKGMARDLMALGGRRRRRRRR